MCKGDWGLQVEEGTELLQEALSVCPRFNPSPWTRVWTHLRTEEPHYSAQEEKEDGKYELTGRGGGRGQKEGVGVGLPYLDLFGMKGQDETKEQEGGETDGAFNQEQVERPLLGETETGVSSPVSTHQSPLPSSQTAFPFQFPIS